MKKYLLFIFLFSLVLFSACTNKQKIVCAIKNWELSQNIIDVNRIELNGEPSLFLSSDSILVLEQNLKLFTDQKKIQLDNELQSINARILSTKNKINLTQNSLMKKAIKHKLYELDKERENHLQIIDIYTNKPELTQIGVLQSRINKYQSSPDQLIGYVFTAKIYGKLGNINSITEEKVYLLAPEMNAVIAEKN